MGSSLSLVVASTIVLSTVITASPIVSLRDDESSKASDAAKSCIVTEYAQIKAAVEDCRNITLQDIYAPSNSSIELKLKQGSIVTFAGTTSFAFTNSSSFKPIQISGKNVTIQGAPGSVIDGNGSLYWDGLGSNGGVPKPNQFMVLKKLVKGSVVRDLNIQNYPAHGLSITMSDKLTIYNVMLNNSAGDAPNALSNGKAAAHNSDGFDISKTNRTMIMNSTVFNQDDCVAVTSGDAITVSNMYCSGGHGLSVGSVGGKSNNVVTNILFQNSTIINSQNGARIKTNFNTTGYIANVTYANILLQDIDKFGIDVQQDYLNGGPTGTPSDGVLTENITFQNVTGTAKGKNSMNYQVLCGSSSCQNIVFDNVKITGGEKDSSCNQATPQGGCPN